MTKSVLCVVAAAMLFSSCDFYTTKDKIHTYKTISEINDSLDNMTRQWHRLLDNAVSSKNYAQLRPCRTTLAEFLARNRETVAYLKVNSETANLIDSEEIFLATQANMVAEQYAAFESFTDMTPDDNIHTQLKLVIGDEAAEYAGSMAVRRSLNAFSEKNKLKKKEKMFRK